MTQLVIKKFLNQRSALSAAKQKSACGKLSSGVGIAVNVLLSALKFTVGIVFGSAACIADAANNFSDILTSIISLVGFKLAAKPADEKHPFGHGRYEYVLSLVISFAVLMMGADLLKNGIAKIMQPTQVEFSGFFVAVLVLSIVLKLWLSWFNRALYKQTGIVAIAAVMKDSLSDCLCTAAVLVSLLIQQFFGLNLDGYVAAGVALFVLWSGIGILRDSLNLLIGKPASKETVAQLREFMMNECDCILGVHDIMLHDYGMGRIFAVAHAEVPADGSLCEVHDEIDALEKATEQRFGIQLVVHIDPVEQDNKRAQQLQRAVLAVVKSVDEHYSVHDFRLSADGKTMHFDLVIDSDLKKDAAQIERMVQSRLQATLGDAPKAEMKVEFPFTGQ